MNLRCEIRYELIFLFKLYKIHIIKDLNILIYYLINKNLWILLNIINIQWSYFLCNGLLTF